MNIHIKIRLSTLFFLILLSLQNISLYSQENKQKNNIILSSNKTDEKKIYQLVGVNIKYIPPDGWLESTIEKDNFAERVIFKKLTQENNQIIIEVMKKIDKNTINDDARVQSNIWKYIQNPGLQLIENGIFYDLEIWKPFLQSRSDLLNQFSEEDLYDLLETGKTKTTYCMFGNLDTGIRTHEVINFVKENSYFSFLLQSNEDSFKNDQRMFLLSLSSFEIIEN
ncbi:MAG: hypothetical protein ABIH08_05510 [Candidatus Omnitrophota bacterium]